MLREIHKSKITYCSFRDRAMDSQQDFIVESTDEIFQKRKVAVGKDENDLPIYKNRNVLTLAKEARALRLTKDGMPTDASDVNIEDIVFRVMTMEHIPLVPKKLSKAAQAKKAAKEKANAIFEELMDDDDEDIVSAEDPNVIMVPMRVNFPPFYHYRVLDTKTHELLLVGKSHWKGDLISGKFSKDHGRTTDTLATMYVKLCERYATRSNWRGYTYNDEMQGSALVQLSQIGLQFNEFKSQNPFAYYTAAVTNSFTRVLNIEKRMQEIRDDILEANGLTPSWTRQFANDNARDAEKFAYDYNYADPKKKNKKTDKQEDVKPEPKRES